MEKVFIFELSGKFAHWKKFYTNSSSLTYYFPTKTNIIGILASVLELPRDSYYETFSLENIQIAISLQSKIRKKIFAMNYLNTKNFKGHTQIKQEILLPENFNNRTNICYRIYLASKNLVVIRLLTEVKEKVSKNNFGYGIYLGQRQFRGSLEFIDEGVIDETSEIKEEFNQISTIVSKKNINEENLDFENTKSVYIKELTPTSFNSKREIQSTTEIIGEIETGKIELKEGKIQNCFRVKPSKGEEEIISFI